MVSFLYMDDSFDDETRISSLTGLLVPVEKYREVRSDFYKILLRAIPPVQGEINLALPELHGNNFLRTSAGADDDRRIQVFDDVASVVISHRLEIYRIGYYVTKKLSRLIPHDSRLMGICWTAMLRALEPRIDVEMVIPIMDGFDRLSVQRFSSAIKSADIFRAHGFEQSLSVARSPNIGEVLYADSKFSTFTQVVDVISYLRKVTDSASEGKTLTGFKRRLLQSSDRLSPLAYEERTMINLNGHIQRP